MPAMHSKLSEKGVTKVRHQKLKRPFSDTHMHASLLKDFSSKCRRQTEANQQVKLVITVGDNQFASLRGFRGRGHPRGGRGRPRGGLGVPPVPHATGGDGR